MKQLIKISYIVAIVTFSVGMLPGQATGAATDTKTLQDWAAEKIGLSPANHGVIEYVCDMRKKAQHPDIFTTPVPQDLQIALAEDLRSFLRKAEEAKHQKTPSHHQAFLQEIITAEEEGKITLRWHFHTTVHIAIYADKGQHEPDSLTFLENIPFIKGFHATCADTWETPEAFERGIRTNKALEEKDLDAVPLLLRQAKSKNPFFVIVPNSRAFNPAALAVMVLQGIWPLARPSPHDKECQVHGLNCRTSCMMLHDYAHYESDLDHVRDLQELVLVQTESLKDQLTQEQSPALRQALEEVVATMTQQIATVHQNMLKLLEGAFMEDGPDSQPFKELGAFILPLFMSSSL